MEDKELIGIAADIIATDVKHADQYENLELYSKLKADYVTYFKNEKVAQYTFYAKRNEWFEYTSDGGISHLKGIVADFLKDASNDENRLDLLITLIIWCKRLECEF